MIIKQFTRTYGRTRSRSVDDSIMVNNPNLYKLIPCAKLEKFSQIHLEIGFGNGENIINRSEILQNALQIGVDVYKNGLCKVLRNIHEMNKTNICLSESDARQFFIDNQFTIDVLYIMFPDPWHKKSEKKRSKKRLFGSEFICTVSSFVKNNGLIVFASDHKDYYDDMRKYLLQHNTSSEIVEEQINRHPTFFNSISENYFVESNYEKKAVSDRWYGVLKKSNEFGYISTSKISNSKV